MKYGNAILNTFCLIVTAGAITLEILRPDVADVIKYPMLIICLLIVGIPHGAIDHIVTSSIYKLSDSIFDQAKFYLYYLIMMGIMTGIWISNPVIGFVIFACLTIYHFGQADLERLNINLRLKKILFISRGTMVMGLILISDPTYTSPILFDITGFDLMNSQIFNDYHKIIFWFLPIQYFLAQAIIFLFTNIKVSDFLRITLDSFIIFALFAIVNPILAFSVYFGLWHSVGHVKEMLTFFDKTGKKMSIKTFYIKALPLNIITLAGISLVYWGSVTYNIQLHLVSLLFIIISILTLPHMLIVEKMYAKMRKQVSN